VNAADEFSLESARVGASFDRAARDYDAAAFLQKEVGERLLERLELTTLKPERIVDIGCGTGRPTRLLVKRYPEAEVIGADLAPGMLRMAAKRQPWIGKGAKFVCAEASKLPIADASCDLLYASLLLQWCEDLDATLLEWRRLLRPHGLLLFSTLGPDTLKELRAAWSEVDEFNHVNRFLDMHDVGDALIRAGFVEPVMDVEHMILTYEDAPALMRDLKSIGAHNVTAVGSWVRGGSQPSVAPTSVSGAKAGCPLLMKWSTAPPGRLSSCRWMRYTVGISGPRKAGCRER
jgi:malonyl-CoA O-methyltransferase